LRAAGLHAELDELLHDTDSLLAFRELKLRGIVAILEIVVVDFERHSPTGTTE
jgi:hypothetical protein